ncbi:MFS transporter [Chloroflexota bacterium]
MIDIDARTKAPRTSRVLPVASVVTFLGFLDTHLLIPVMALYASGLGASVGITGLIIGLYSITNTPSNILFGRLIDRVGYKVPLIGGLLGSSVSMLGYSLCRLPVHLAVVRAIHGMSGGLIGPATMSVIANYSGEARKGRAMSFYGIAIAASTLVGFGLSGIIVSRLGYNVLFTFAAIMLAVGAIVAFALPKARQISITEAKAPASQDFDKAKGLLRRRGLIASYSSVFAQYFAFGGVVTLLPLYVQNLGMEAFHVGMLLTTFTAMFLFLQFPSGIISDKAGRRIPIVASLSLGTVSLVLLPHMTTFPLLAVAMALYGIAWGVLFPSISALVTDHTVPEERGMATGIFHALLTAGVAIGAFAIGWIGEVAGIETGLLSIPGIMALALIIALRTLKHA